MSNPSEVYPIWKLEESKQTINLKENKKSNQLTQKFKTSLIGFRQSESNRLKSPDLHFRGLANSLWYLTIDPRIKQNDSDHYYFGLFLHLKSKQMERFSGQIAKIKTSIIDTKRGKAWTKSSKPLFYQGQSGWGWKYFVTRNHVFEDCKRSIDLKINVSITCIQWRDINESHKEGLLNCGDSDKKLDEFSFTHDLMNDREYCDIHFVVGDVDFAAHSKLLASKSSVFNKLFAKQNEITITGMDSFVFYELISYIYRGYSPNIERYCQKLLIAADHYRIPRLKSVCDYLCFRDLTSDEAIDALIFADKYQTFSAKLRTLCFIAINLNQIVSSSADNWKTFEDKYKDLFKEIMEINEMKCLCPHH